MLFETTMSTKHLYIQTFGCQMNVYDSDQMAGLLRPLGYQPVDRLEAADLIILNTCAIRAKAEQKVFSFLGRLAKLKRRKPSLIIAVGGCIAQQEGRRVFERVPFVDLVFGTHAIHRLPQSVGRIEAERCRLVDIEESPLFAEIDPAADPGNPSAVSRFVTIMQGCDNYCTYCVVPYVRGRERSRRPESVVAEIRGLVSGGAREVVLLGQNVNSYGQKEGLPSFAQLLAQVNAIEGLYRIRFTTSHPKDLSDELIEAFSVLDKLCAHIHLPVQSGSDAVLRRMNRKYSRSGYLETVDRLRRRSPDIAITSDIIVGFPGETPRDFEDTLSLVAQVGFDGIFAFAYSDRPNAKAAHFDDKLPAREKSDRLHRLLDLQDSITAGKNRSLIGTHQEVLVEGRSRRLPDSEAAASAPQDAPAPWTGRTSTHKIVHLAPPAGETEDRQDLTGRLVTVSIERALAHSLWGQRVSTNPKRSQSKGDQAYAA